MITQSQMEAGVDNPMCRPENNPTGGGSDYDAKAHSYIEALPKFPAESLASFVAVLVANRVRPDDGLFYDVHVSYDVWREMAKDELLNQIGLGEMGKLGDPPFVVTFKVLGVRVHVGFDEYEPHNVVFDNAGVTRSAPADPPERPGFSLNLHGIESFMKRFKGGQ